MCPSARRCEAVHHQFVKDRAISGGHEARRSHDGAWRGIHDAACLVEMLSRSFRNLGAGTPNLRVFHGRHGIIEWHLCRRERLSRKIEPADRRILVDIAQDVGELKGASQMVGQSFTGLVVKAEDPH
jgi:hypothetical protein